MSGKQCVARKENTMVLYTGSRRRAVESVRPSAGRDRPAVQGTGRLRHRSVRAALILGAALLGITAQQALAAPNVTLSEGSLHFDSQNVGTTSSAETVVVSNHGPGTLEI